MSNFYPVCEPTFNGNERRYLLECLDSGWISSEGPFIKRFERGFAEFAGVTHGIAVSSGTAALETALHALGVGKGDEVIMPSFTIFSCAMACMRLGAKPVLVDIDPDIWTMDVNRVEAKITERTRVVMPVHMYGHPVDMDGLFRLRDKHGFLLLEDAAEVHGAEYFSRYRGGKWYKCGSMGDAAATSFYANKIITTGEGGMVLTGDDERAAKAISYRNLAFGADKRFHHLAYGYNFRMTNLQAAVGLAQLEQVDSFIAAKKRVAERYRTELAGVPGLRFMPSKEWARPVYWMCCIMLEEDAELSADTVITRLKQNNIQARPFFTGLHRQPVLLEEGLFQEESCPNTDLAARYGLYLPSSVSLSDEDVAKIVDVLKGVI